MEKEVRYTFTREEALKMFSDKIGKPVSRIRFSSKTQTIICEIMEKDK